ncbi:hypothetical protein BGW38_000649 [Lunasporangiospora selenospora]|uniref:Nucleolar complex-associated protein 3 n=1 Tax=Lunasporangiospora selenospora TaxID=979761 RepID=A0A9P6FVC6_9FUNG|nr:hypothetical protein BGW38_000649 [Lunasporangiospora selenospora]
MAPPKKGPKGAKPSSGAKPKSAKLAKGGKPAGAAPAQAKGKKGGQKKGNKEEKQIKVPKIITNNFESHEDIEIDDYDIEFFNENSQMSGFLTKMDVQKIAKNEIIKAKKKTTFGELKKSAGSVEMTLDDIESESDSDEDDEAMDIDMADSDTAESEDEDDEEEESKDESEPEEIDSDEEQDYEQAPRKAEGWTEKVSQRLPIKLADGRIQEVKDDRERPSQKRKADEDESGEESEDVVDSDFAEEDDDALGQESESVIEEPAQPETKASKKAQLTKKKEELAAMAQSVISNPEENVGMLRRLRMMAQDPSDVIKKLAMLTQLAVYKDILPGYRIRTLSDKEMDVKVSKDVSKLRDYEQSLLQNYQNYLLSLEKVMAQDKSDKDEEDEANGAGSNSTTGSLTAPAAAKDSAADGKQKAISSLATVAVHCMCTLLTSVTHFNFRLNLMTALIARMSRRRWSEQSETCSKALKDVFVEDESGEVSLDAVKLMTKMIKSKSYLVHPNAINVFLALRLREELPTRHGGEEDSMSRKRKKKDRVHISKKNRKLLKAKKEVEVEMKEAEAVVDKEEKQRTQTETLKLVFVTYFRILKHAPGSPLLPNVLEGLARFAHLINIDFFTDLMEVLKKIMVGGADSQHFDPYTAANRRTQLLCIVSAFQLLQGQGEALNIDLKAFYTEFYTSLMTSAMNPDIEGDIFEAAQESIKEKEKQQKLALAQRKGRSARGPIEEEIMVLLPTDRDLIMKGFELLFFKTKGKIPIIRSAAFLKRIAVASLQFPNKTMQDFLVVMKKLIQKQPQLDQMLTSSDEDRAGNGVYLPALNDPELCNPMAASLWEFELMKTHFDPKVRTMATALSVFAPSAGQVRVHDRSINK